MNKLLLLIMFIAMPVFASPVNDLKLVGYSEMNWMFWKLYDIRLLSADGEYRENQYPLALAIEYAREIDASMLIDSTIKEWERLSVSWKEDWTQQLKGIWPSVKPGDELLIHVEISGISHFYFNNQRIGKIVDPDFAPAFLSIWLSTSTREPDIRKQLMGKSDA